MSPYPLSDWGFSDRRDSFGRSSGLLLPDLACTVSHNDDKVPIERGSRQS
jgi:hypothetical protein